LLDSRWNDGLPTTDLTRFVFTDDGPSSFSWLGAVTDALVTTLPCLSEGLGMWGWPRGHKSDIN
jgi:hypothetical protein